MHKNTTLRQHLAAIGWIAILPAHSIAATTSGIKEIGTLGGTSTAQGISADGSVIVGYEQDSFGRSQAFRWTADNGMVSLGTLGGGSSVAYGISADGRVIVGNSQEANSAVRAFRWTEANNMVSLGTLGGNYSSANGVNADGSVIVGVSQEANSAVRAFRWTKDNNVMESLGTLGGAYSFAQGVNADGSVIVGYEQDSSGHTQAFRWTEANNMVSLGTLGGNGSSAWGISADGSVIVGESVDSSGNNQAFRWTEANNVMESLGTLGGDHSVAYGVNADGSVIVGSSHYGSGNYDVSAFRWTQDTGMQSIEAWLASHNVTVDSDINTREARAVSSDGNVIAGSLANGRAFIARVSSDGSGIIDPVAFQQGLSRVTSSALQALRYTDLVLNGMHGSPVRRIVSDNQSTFWTAGDFGKQNRPGKDNELYLGEIGYGQRINKLLQLNLALGTGYNASYTGLGGRTAIRQWFALPELIVTLPANAYATLSAIYARGKVDIDRRYLNAGTPASSTGNADVSSYGAKLRLDWLNAATLGNTQFTPYASFDYLETRMDGYTEQGGGFPVIWHDRKEKTTTARLGLDVTHAASNTLTWLGRIEGIHRFENRGVTTTGQIVGLNSFSFAGQAIKQNWLRLGIGMDAKLGSGIASVMLNGTNEGEDPTYWLAASYRWTF